MEPVSISLGDFTRSVSQEALSRHSNLLTGRSVRLLEYHVQSPVGSEILAAFLDGIRQPGDIVITKANISDLLLLSEEFGVPELTARCESFHASGSAVSPRQKFDRQFEAVSNHVERLEREISSLAADVRVCSDRLLEVERHLSPFFPKFDRTITASLSPFTVLNNSVKCLKEILSVVNCPLKEVPSRDGIISYLTRKHEGNVLDQGSVAITSKSVLNDDPKLAVQNLADLVSPSWFKSKNEPGQWVCWDFHKMRVWPTHYTVWSGLPKSWVIESSMDGENWTEIDRRIDNSDLYGDPYMASFAISNSGQCHFIRFAQIGPNHANDDRLAIHAFEFFGAILE